MVLLAVIVDTAILPVFYYGTYTVSLTLAVVLCASLVLGRLKGMLLGMIGGLLIDITAGTLGMMTFFDLAVGFLIGFYVELYGHGSYPMLIGVDLLGPLLQHILIWADVKSGILAARRQYGEQRETHCSHTQLHWLEFKLFSHKIII